METDDELEQWRRQWQAEGVVPPDLRRRVEQDVRRRGRSFWAEVAVTVLLGGGTTLWAAVSADSAVVLVLAAVWLFIGITWATSIHLDQALAPKPLTETTSAFLEYAIQSCRRRRRGIAAAAALYAGFFGFMLTWKYWQLAAATPLDVWTYITSGRVVTQCAITAILAVAALDRRRRLTRDLEYLTSLRQNVG